ncbi:MAG: glycoside hydrolase family 3 C-terminal domain-containing protein, partial [Clostridia bacterium]
MENKIKSLLNELTLEEKAALCSGVAPWETTPISRLGIPSVFVADGPHGVRREVESEGGIGNVFKDSLPATCFPPAVTLASTWDKALLGEVGAALADECLEQGVSVLLGPGINIKRNPLCGRNFEYFSEDPYLTGELAAAYINGIQQKGVGTSLKHYAINSQEFRRLVSSSDVDERTAREIYLSAFETAVKKSQPYTIMSSYNRINGVYAGEDKNLLTQILREEWGYQGLVVSDWGAVSDRVKGVWAGLDLQMPSSNGEHDKMIVNAVKSGKLDIDDLDTAVTRVLRFVFKCHEVYEKNKGYKADYKKHHALARRAAAEGSVLLKNTGPILPLAEGAEIAVIGELADKLRSQGSGSSRLNPKDEVSFLAALQRENIKFEYAPGYSVTSPAPKEDMIYQACKLAESKENVLLFIGLTEDFESEGFDREHLSIPPSHITLLEEIYKYNKNIIVVLTGGSPVVMPWIDKAAAVLNVYLTGEAGGESTLDVLFGRVNPSGKLAETYPLQLSDVLSTNYFGKYIAEYRESIYVGYRYFDTANKPVLFPFGHGLSYTAFEYSNLTLSAEKITDNDTLEISFDVKNIGQYEGKEVVQVYVNDIKSTIFMSDKQLKAFEKISLKAGETKTVTIELDARSFAFYNIKTKSWTAEEGEFDILVGSSSRDIRLDKRVYLVAQTTEIADFRDAAPNYYDIAKAAEIPEAQFEALLGASV